MTVSRICLTAWVAGAERILLQRVVLPNGVWEREQPGPWRFTRRAA